jgi:hypothetical protein
MSLNAGVAIVVPFSDFSSASQRRGNSCFPVNRASIFRRTSSFILISGGQGRLKPSPGSFFAASMPILVPGVGVNFCCHASGSRLMRTAKSSTTLKGGFTNPQHVVSALAQPEDAIFRDILVGAEPHGETSAAQSEDFFLVQAFLSIRHAGANLFARQPIIASDFLLRPALCDEAENELDGQPRAANDRLADEDGRIGGNVFLPVHAVGNYACNRGLSAAKSFSTFAFTAASILKSGGQRRLKPSPGSFSVASMSQRWPSN